MTATLPDQIVDHLTDANIGFALIETAADLASVDKSPRAMPAAFVFIKEEASSENENATGGAGPVQRTQQLTETDVAILIITSNKTDRTGGAATTDIDQMKRELRRALLGRVFEGAETPMEHVMGRVVSMKNGFVAYEDVFATAMILESE